jgi:hypothetical protein
MGAANLVSEAVRLGRAARPKDARESLWELNQQLFAVTEREKLAEQSDTILNDPITDSINSVRPQACTM